MNSLLLGKEMTLAVCKKKGSFSSVVTKHSPRIWLVFFMYFHSYVYIFFYVLIFLETCWARSVSVEEVTLLTSTVVSIPISCIGWGYILCILLGLCALSGNLFTVFWSHHAAGWQTQKRWHADLQVYPQPINRRGTQHTAQHIPAPFLPLHPSTLSLSFSLSLSLSLTHSLLCSRSSQTKILPLFSYA